MFFVNLPDCTLNNWYFSEYHKLQSSLVPISPEAIGSNAKNGNDASSTSGGASPSSHHNTLSPSHNSSLPNTPTSIQQQHTLNQAFLGKYTGQRNTGSNVFQYPSSIYQTQNQPSSGHLLNTNVLQSSINTSTGSAINSNAYNYLEMFSSQQGLGSGETAIVKMEPPASAHLSYQSEHTGTTEHPSRSPSVEHESHHEGLATTVISGTNNDITRHERPTVVSISGWTTYISRWFNDLLTHKDACACLNHWLI